MNSLNESNDPMVKEIVVKFNSEEMKDALIPNPFAKEDALADDFEKTSPMDEENGSAEKQTGISDGKKVSKKTKKYFKKYFKRKSKKKSPSRQLLNDLTPKDAVMILGDLKDVTINTMNIKRDHEGKIGAHIVVNSVEYHAEGSSLNSARTAACEQALNDIFMAKMQALVAEPEKHSGGDADDLLLKLASYAIHKLFEQWKSQNIDVEALYNGMKDKKKPAIDQKTSSSVKELPKKWKTMHPCGVLSYMRPKTLFKNLGSTGELPNQIFTMGISVDGSDFEAKGKSKKSVRYNLAVQACNKLFGTDFPDI